MIGVGLVAWVVLMLWGLAEVRHRRNAAALAWAEELVEKVETWPRY